MSKPNSDHQAIELTMIIVPDAKTGRYSAFFAQFPEAIAVADDEAKVQKSLVKIFSTMMSDKAQEVLKDPPEGVHYISKQANLVFA